MITITRHDDHFIFNVKGMHKLWAFKSELSIPCDHILHAFQDAESLKGWSGLRLPGTYVPFLITAGTFYKQGEKIFWDVVNMDKSIIIDLKDEDYKQLVIEVEDPAAAIMLLTSHN